MPKVGSKHFPYTKKGIAAAKRMMKSMKPMRKPSKRKYYA